MPDTTNNHTCPNGPAEYAHLFRTPGIITSRQMDMDEIIIQVGHTAETLPPPDQQ